MCNSTLMSGTSGIIYTRNTDVQSLNLIASRLFSERHYFFVVCHYFFVVCHSAIGDDVERRFWERTFA